MRIVITSLMLVFACVAGADDCSTTEVPEIAVVGVYLASVILVAVLIALAVLLMLLQLKEKLSRRNRLTLVACGGVVIDLYVGIVLLLKFLSVSSNDVTTLCGRPSCGSTVLHDMAFYVGVNIFLYVVIEVGVSSVFVYITYEYAGTPDATVMHEVLLQLAQVVAAFVLTFSFLPMAMPLLAIPSNDDCIAVNNFFDVMHYAKVHSYMALVTAALTFLGLIFSVPLWLAIGWAAANKSVDGVLDVTMTRKSIQPLRARIPP
jgi:hypothetical protein